MTAPTTPTGSRLIVATVPSGDGATWPYSLSAASACHRMQDAVSGTSSPTVSVIGLPASIVSIRPISRPFASIRSAQRMRIRFRSPGLRRDQRPSSNGYTRRGDRGVDVGRPALRDLGDWPAGRRVLRDVAAPGDGLAEFAADERLGPQPQPTDLGRGLVPRRDQRVGHRGLRSGDGRR
jgi:hypothetical protein